MLELIHNLLTNSKLTSNITASALFRTIEKDESCTILIDEADTIFGRYADKEKAEALRGLGNAGFKRGAEVIGCEGNSFEPRGFKVFCPVVLAGIGTSAIPETIADRSIVIEMRRKMVHENVSEYESDEIEEVFGPIRLRLNGWVNANKQHFRATRPEFPKELHARARDVWKPLLKIAENIDEEWRMKVFNAATALSIKAEDPEDISLPLRLLKDCREVLKEESIPSRDLIARLRSLEESPWAFMDGFNPAFLARMLKSYGIRSTHWSNYRGYKRVAFEDSWRRYLPPVSVTPVTLVSIHDTSDNNDGFPKVIQQFVQDYAQTIQ